MGDANRRRDAIRDQGLHALGGRALLDAMTAPERRTLEV
jgi:hypothetical protein